MKKSTRQPLPTRVFPFTWLFLKKYKGSLVIFLITAIIWSGDLSIAPYLLKLIIDGANSTANTPLLLWTTIAVPVAIYASLSLLLNLTFRVWGITVLRLFPAIRESAISAVYFYLCQHSYRYFQEHFSGTLANKLSDLSNGLEPVIQLPNTVFIPRAMAAAFAVGMLTLVQPIFGLVLLVWLTVFVIITVIYAQYTENAALEFSEASTQFSGQMNDGITNIITTKIFANEKYECQRILKGIHHITVKDRLMQWRMQVSHFVQGLLVTVLIIALLYLLISQRMLGLVTVGDFAFVLSLAVMFTFQIWDLGQQYVHFTKELSKCQQALNVLLIPHEIPNKSHAENITIQQGAIEFRDVHFRYNNDKGLFDHLSVTIKPGEKVGLVGYSGGGKSSFIRLIMRLYELESGQILIDGHPIEAFTKESLRSQIAMIPQEPEMFHRTILDNIRYGRLNASEDEVIEAAKKAHAHDFIVKLPQGYHALVGEKGVKLSGGQRQRIAIARAILKQAPIIILDEATSALDSITERLIQDSLHEMMKNKTTIVIAHRLSTLREMDRILLFNEGKIIEDGSLEELRKHGGHFAKLWSMQGGGYLPETPDKE